MLRFIIFIRKSSKAVKHFNTSHVTVYPVRNCLLGLAKLISIHPMLRFIDKELRTERIDPIFQYIPCYGLSAVALDFCIVRYIFQYIPCYGLSGASAAGWSPGSEFQYIPCYGLSKSDSPTERVIIISIHPMLRFIPYFFTVDTFLSNISIHPMLRFIGNIPEKEHLFTGHFNTSHVTVYHAKGISTQTT